MAVTKLLHIKAAGSGSPGRPLLRKKRREEFTLEEIPGWNPQRSMKR